jgi:hypothetical protein
MEAMYRALDGGIHHASCGRRLVLRGRRADELDFGCPACEASVALPTCAILDIRVAYDAATDVT